jgi:membrane fusion protein (multidrug efflux system)
MRPLLFPLTVLLLATACKSKEADPLEKSKPSPLPPVKVETAGVTHEMMPRFLTLTGSVIADRQSEIAASVSGRVVATYVERGMPVKAGQAIAVVDSKAAGLQAAAAMAQSQAAQSQVTLAKQDCDRADTLFSQGAIPKSEFERLKTQCTSQLYTANAAQANADLAGKLAGDTVIRSPIDGIIGERYVSTGEYVQPPTRVASVFSVNPARISISVPEPAIGLVKEGQTLDIEVSSWPDRRFPATVRFVGPALRPQTRDLIIEASAKNEDGALKPGMYATVKLVIGEDEQLTVPLDAIKQDGTVRRLFVAKDKRIVELVVKTGLVRDGRIAVLEPLSTDTQVVIKPPPGLSDGSSIQ